MLNTCEKSKPENKAQFINERFFGEKLIELFRYELSQIEWKNIIKTLDNSNTLYENLFYIFFKTYDKYFPKFKFKLKTETIQSPWITKDIRKSSKKKTKAL